MTEDTQRITEAVEAEAQDGRLPCAKALALAKRLGVSPEAVGRACNEAGIKIKRCQLGCFP